MTDQTVILPQKKVHLLLLVISFLTYLMITVSDLKADLPAPWRSNDRDISKILVLNSYHKGYKWSDDIVKGIEDNLLGRQFDIRTEYMDTKRIEDPRYLDLLAEIYRYKFSMDQFDLVITSDDTAFNFIRQYHDTIFKSAPVIACGLNYFDPKQDLWCDQFVAAIPEIFDIEGTINAALTVHPGSTTLYVINDQTPTGQLIQKAFDDIRVKFEDRLTFVSLVGVDVKTIQETLATAPENSLALLLVYFKDDNNHFYEPEQAARMFTGPSRVPVYGVWDFYMNFGITGGVLTRGYGQGRVAGQTALHFLSGMKLPENRVIQESGNALVFDADLLKRFSIASASIPREGTILNMKYEDQKNILILNSYDDRLKWTHDTVEGMLSVLDSEDFQKRIYIEYMDTTNFPEPETYSHLLDLYYYKYAHTKFDLVLTSDDNAFRFVLKNRESLFQDAPVVFCGVNYLDDGELEGHTGVTGIVETTDIRGTVELMHLLHPDARKVLVINDRSTTGQANNRRVVEEIPTRMASTIQFEFLPDLKMTELQRDLKALSRDSLVLLMTFNRDQNNDVFSYRESIDLIASHTDVPMYGVWDFYLGSGILGGLLCSGREQGVQAAQMAVNILSGIPADAIPIVRESDAIPMFDGHYLRQYGISENVLPPGSRIINQLLPFNQRHPTLVRIGVVVLAFLGFLLIYLLIRLRFHQQVRKTLEVEARIDPLTQLLNRSAGMKAFAAMVKGCNHDRITMTLCYVDINKLKYVNDTFGHTEGDRYIQLVASTIKGCVRDVDVLTRIGGDEFLLFLYDHGLKGAGKIIQRIRRKITHNGDSGKYPYPVGASFGMAVYDPSDPCSMDELLERADADMYRNKERR